MDKNIKKLEKALFDKAVGFTSQEVVEEYSLSGDEMILQKRKTSTKCHPPDLSAIQFILEKGEENEFNNMTDDELEAEKNKYLKLLKEKK